MLRLVALALALTPLAAAQDVVSLSAGWAEFDLSGTGSAAVVDARAQFPLVSLLSVEAGLGLTPTDQQYGSVTYLLPSAELQVGPTIGGRVRPYLGLGVGAFVPVTDPGEQPFGSGTVDYDPETEGALVVALGLDAGVTDRWLVRLAGRLRGTVGEGPDVFVGTFTELTAGAGFRF